MELEDDMPPEYHDYLQRANHARGWVINYTILLERIMDDFMAIAFSDTQEKKIDLLETLISEGMSYNSKVNVVLRLVKRHLPDDKQREIRFPGLRKNLQDIAAERNKFAHELLYINLSIEQFKKFEICLVSFKNLDKVECFVLRDITGIVERIQKYIDILDELRREFWQQ